MDKKSLRITEKSGTVLDLHLLSLVNIIGLSVAKPGGQAAWSLWLALFYIADNEQS
jgi:hypothetical protein